MVVPVEDVELLLDGPWRHRFVTARGVRFHVAEAGEGPLVLLLHGFPQNWWCWRHQLVALADAGYRAVAPDLKGYGATDKPPRGYDAPTAADDVAGLVRALGEQDAVVVGHDWGGFVAWTLAALHPGVVRRLGVVDMPHPLALRRALLTDPAQLRASSYVGGFQVPRRAEADLLADDAAQVGELLRRWSAPGWPSAEEERFYRRALQVRDAAHCSLEWYRWAVRSLVRPDGLRYARDLARRPARGPVLQLHGAMDGALLERTARASGRWVDGEHRFRLVEDAGHFLAEERPALVADEVVALAGS